MRADTLLRQDPAGTPVLLGTILQVIGIGVVVLDEQFCVQYANGSAASELVDGGRLAQRERHLVAVQPEQRRRLSQALEAALCGRQQLVELGPADDSRMFACVPLAQAGLHILVLCGRDHSFDASLRGMYAQAMGLTSSESEVLASVCQGLVAQDIAVQRQVKVSTVKSQIGSIREKIGARSMAEMVAKVSSLPPLASQAF